MIRRATIADLDAVMPMAANFYQSCPWVNVFAYDEEQMRAGMSALLESEATGFFVIDAGDKLVGAAAFYLAPAWMAARNVIAQEVFWWVEPEYRRGGEGLALWVEAERWAEAAGAKAISMIRLDGMDDEALHRTYTRRGYTSTEHHYVRKL